MFPVAIAIPGAGAADDDDDDDDEEEEACILILTRLRADPAALDDDGAFDPGGAGNDDGD